MTLMKIITALPQKIFYQFDVFSDTNQELSQFAQNDNNVKCNQ